jgi:hypothetical protein
MSASNTAAIAMRSATKISGDEKGIPYLTPTNPVLHRNTKLTGANLAAVFFMKVASRTQ